MSAREKRRGRESGARDKREMNESGREARARDKREREISESKSLSER